MIEGDLRRPSFARYLGLSTAAAATSAGFLHLLRGEAAELDAAIERTAQENLDVLPAGGRDFLGSTRLLAGPRVAGVLEALRARYDHILIDAPPVAAVADACLLGALSDEALLVVRLHSTPTPLVERAKHVLREAGCDLGGVILTHLRA